MIPASHRGASRTFAVRIWVIVNWSGVPVKFPELSLRTSSRNGKPWAACQTTFGSAISDAMPIPIQRSRERRIARGPASVMPANDPKLSSFDRYYS